MTTDDFKPTQRKFQSRRGRARLAIIALAQKRLALAHGRLALLAPLNADYAEAINEYRDAFDAHTKAVNPTQQEK